MKHLLPKWKSGGKQDMIKQIYGENTTDMMRESMGVTTSENNNVFDQRWMICCVMVFQGRFITHQCGFFVHVIQMVVVYLKLQL